MPIYDFRCPACHCTFERLVRADTVPACPQCQSTQVERAVSRIAPAGRIEAIRLSNRRAADRQGHFSHLSPGERAKLLK